MLMNVELQIGKIFLTVRLWSRVSRAIWLIVAPEFVRDRYAKNEKTMRSFRNRLSFPDLAQYVLG